MFINNKDIMATSCYHLEVEGTVVKKPNKDSHVEWIYVREGYGKRDRELMNYRFLLFDILSNVLQASLSKYISDIFSNRSRP